MIWQTKWTKLNMAALLLVCTGVVAGPASAQMYKWKDAKGITHFTETPPPAEVKDVETKAYATSAPQPELTGDVGQAARTFPVTLYTSASCGGCDLGRTLLRTHGIPYNEKTVSTAADQAALKTVSSGDQLPFLQVGPNKLTGFEQARWEASLTAAGYPATSQLPPTYQPKVSSAGPRPDPNAAPTDAQGSRAKRPAEPAQPPAQPADKPNFQF